MNIRELQRYILANPDDLQAARRLLAMHRSRGIPVPPHMHQLIYNEYPVIKFSATDFQWMIVEKIEALNDYLMEFEETPDVDRRQNIAIRYPKLLKITLEDRSQWLVISHWGIAKQVIEVTDMHDEISGFDERNHDVMLELAEISENPTRWHDGTTIIECEVDEEILHDLGDGCANEILMDMIYEHIPTQYNSEFEVFRWQPLFDRL